MTTKPGTGDRQQKSFPTTTIVLVLICIMYGFTYMDRTNVSTASSIFKTELHLSNTQVGLVFSAFAYPYLMFQIIGGWVGDRFGARKALTVSAIIWRHAADGTCDEPDGHDRRTGDVGIW